MEEKDTIWKIRCKKCQYKFYSDKYKPIKKEKKREAIFSKRAIFAALIPGLSKLIKPKIITYYFWERSNYFAIFFVLAIFLMFFT